MRIPSKLTASSHNLSKATGQVIHKLYSSHAVIGAATDSDELPHDVRKYASYERSRLRDELGANKYQFSAAAPGNLFTDYKGQLCVPYLHYLSQDPRRALRGGQNTGDCVSWAKRTAIDMARTFEIEAGQVEEYRLRTATAGLYAERGHRGSGASPTRIARAALRIGILLEKPYESPDGEVWDFSDYDQYWRIGVNYGRSGLPDWITDITSVHAPRDVAEIETEEELLTALWNGCGVSLGSMMGVSTRGGKDGVPFLSALDGSWAHDMAVVGFDDRRIYHKDTLIIWDQSWGPGWNYIEDWPAEFGPKPEGAFVLTLEDTMKHVRRGECHAISDVDGFRPRRQATLGAGGVI